MTRQLESNTGYRLEAKPEAPETLSPAAREYWLKLLPIIFELGSARNCDLAEVVQ